MFSSSLPKNWQTRLWSNAKVSRHKLSDTDYSTHTTHPASQAAELRRPPPSIYLFIRRAEYRKWASSHIILRFSPILPARFKRRMRKRIMKHQGAASRLAQKRDAITARLTPPAREIFQELEALYAYPLKSNGTR